MILNFDGLSRKVQCSRAVFAVAKNKTDSFLLKKDIPSDWNITHHVTVDEAMEASHTDEVIFITTDDCFNRVCKFSPTESFVLGVRLVTALGETKTLGVPVGCHQLRSAQLVGSVFGLLASDNVREETWARDIINQHGGKLSGNLATCDWILVLEPLEYRAKSWTEYLLVTRSVYHPKSIAKSLLRVLDDGGRITEWSIYQPALLDGFSLVALEEDDELKSLVIKCGGQVLPRPVKGSIVLVDPEPKLSEGDEETTALYFSLTPEHHLLFDRMWIRDLARDSRWLSPDPYSVDFIRVPHPSSLESLKNYRFYLEEPSAYIIGILVDRNAKFSPARFAHAVVCGAVSREEYKTSSHVLTRFCAMKLGLEATHKCDYACTPLTPALQGCVATELQGCVFVICLPNIQGEFIKTLVNEMGGSVECDRCSVYAENRIWINDKEWSFREVEQALANKLVVICVEGIINAFTRGDNPFDEQYLIRKVEDSEGRAESRSTGIYFSQEHGSDPIQPQVPPNSTQGSILSASMLSYSEISPPAAAKQIVFCDSRARRESVIQNVATFIRDTICHTCDMVTVGELPVKATGVLPALSPAEAVYNYGDDLASYLPKGQGVVNTCTSSLRNSENHVLRGSYASQSHEDCNMFIRQLTVSMANLCTTLGFLNCIERREGCSTVLAFTKHRDDANDMLIVECKDELVLFHIKKKFLEEFCELPVLPVAFADPPVLLMTDRPQSDSIRKLRRQVPVFVATFGEQVEDQGFPVIILDMGAENFHFCNREKDEWFNCPLPLTPESVSDIISALKNPY